MSPRRIVSFSVRSAFYLPLGQSGNFQTPSVKNCEGDWSFVTPKYALGYIDFKLVIKKQKIQKEP